MNKIQETELEAFKLLPDSCESLLDIGCGEGSVTEELSKISRKTTGIDFSSVAVDLARKKGINASVCDVNEGLPFPDRQFDVIWCGDIIEHVFDPVFLMCEIKRVLTDDGVVVATIPNDMQLTDRISMLRGVSPQSHIYRRFKQVKHHSVMSLELMSFFVDEGGLRIDDFISFCRIPKLGHEFKTGNRKLAELFGKLFIMKIKKNI